MKSNHRHRATTSKVYPFAGPVSDREDPRAHGNICVVSYCNCGATRRENINQRWIERGPWEKSE